MKKIWFVILSAVGILLLVWGAVLNATESSTLGIIGGADGPTAIFVTGSTGGYPPCVCTETAVRFSFFKNPKC